MAPLFAPQDVTAVKAAAKARVQRAYGLEEGSGHCLLVSLGRLSHQKGSDVLVAAATKFLARCPQVGVPATACHKVGLPATACYCLP